MGVYRKWRDAGYGVDTLLIGLVMDLVGLEAAFHLTGTLMFVSSAFVYVWMEETHPDFGTHTPPAPEVERDPSVTTD